LNRPPVCQREVAPHRQDLFTIEWLRYVKKQRMTLDLPATLAILFSGLLFFALAVWRANRPPNPLKVRMVNWRIVQIFTIIFVLVFASHLVTLILGHPLPPRRGTAP
jgi:hypothetical protein